MNGIKLLVVVVVTAGVYLGCLCGTSSAAEPNDLQPTRIVQEKGPWILLKRGSHCYWMYDARYAHHKVECAGKRIVSGAANIVTGTVETAGEIVVGAGAIVIGTGAEVLDRTGCAVRCIILGPRCRPCFKRHRCPIELPPVEDSNPAPPRIELGEPKPPTLITVRLR
jgi:hypothetical protein